MIRYVKKARRLQGSTGTSLLQLLEMRLDNVVFRSGFAPTIPGARQAVNHGHITVNGRLVNIASYQCRPGDLVGVRQREASRQLIEANMQFPGLSNVPAHLDVDKAKLETKVNSVCEREWVALQINELMVIEFYSRKI